MRDKVFADSFLRQVLRKLDKKPANLKMLVLVDFPRLSYSNSNFVNFISVGYDTLRDMDENAIFKYYWEQVSISEAKHNGGNYYDTRTAPLDINFGVGNRSNNVGIKIIYRTDYRNRRVDWREIEKLIIYASEHLEIIRSNQSRQIVRFDYNGYYVSLRSLDTAAIHDIIGRPVVSDSEKIEIKSVSNVVKKKTSDNNLGRRLKYCVAIVILLGSTTLFFALRTLHRYS